VITRRRSTTLGFCWRRGRCTPGALHINHLLALAQTHGIPRSRVRELIELVGLSDVANKRVGPRPYSTRSPIASSRC